MVILAQLALIHAQILPQVIMASLGRGSQVTSELVTDDTPDGTTEPLLVSRDR